MADNESHFPMNGDLKRDSYGFTVRPQHLEIYREYSHIYKAEEKERSEKWRNFTEHYGESVPLCSPANKHSRTSDAETTNEKTELISDSCRNGNDCSAGHPVSSATDGSGIEVAEQEDNSYQENTTSFPQKETERDVGNSSNENSNVKNCATSETLFPSKEELEFLVRGGVPKHLRGEIWKAFIGVQTRHVNKYYQSLISSEINPDHKKRLDCSTNSLNIDDHCT